MNLFPTIGNLTYSKELGQGSFGSVYLYIENNTNKPYAVKMIDMGRAINEKYLKYLDSELNALKGLKHDNIVKLKDYLKSTNYLLLIMEFCNGYNLLECLEKYKDKNNK